MEVNWLTYDTKLFGSFTMADKWDDLENVYVST